MDDDLIKLGRRAVACVGWRWMGGMSGVWAMGGVWRHWRCYGVGVGSSIKAVVYLGPEGEELPKIMSIGSTYRCLPDLSDPATRGCVLELVREAWGDPRTHLRGMESDWVAVRTLGLGVASGWHSTEAEVLVSALEAAP